MVVNVQPNVSTAQVTFTCSYIQRGDILRPMQERPSPPYKPADKFDHFAPVSGKSVGMLVIGQDSSQTYGQNSIVYVNLGTNQGVKVGDYFRIFRYQGSRSETPPNVADFQYKLFGFGSTPQKYEWNDLPREVLGEGIVIRRGPQRLNHVRHLHQWCHLRRRLRRTRVIPLPPVPFSGSPRRLRAAGFFF